MRGLLYYRPENVSGKQLRTMLKPLFNLHGLTCYRSVADLSKDLRQAANNEGIAILFLDSQEDLDNILRFKDLFWKHKIILILPDMEHETVSRAVQLYPRYMTSLDQGLSDIKAVLRKLLESEGNPAYFSDHNINQKKGGGGE